MKYSMVYFKKQEQSFVIIKHFGLPLLQVRSRGILIKDGSLRIGSSVKNNLLITPDMVPSFRLIGYFYNQHGDIIADSVWVDVRDECEIKVKVSKQNRYECRLGIQRQWTNRTLPCLLTVCLRRVI